jgi:hypothetical protein
MPDDFLSPHFRRSELTCQCGCGECNVSQKLLNTLEIIRGLMNQPLTLTSACRCEAHNIAVGGKGPEHTSNTAKGKQCEAADILCQSDLMRYSLLKIAYHIDIRRIGISKDFIHIGISKGLPGPAVWMY